MKICKRMAAMALTALFAFSLLAGGALGVPGFAADEMIESPILPIIPSDPETELGFVYSFNREKLTAKIVDFTDPLATFAAIPEKVRDGEKTYTVDTVATAAFSALSALESVAIPATVKTVEAYAFDACPKLASVWYEGNKAAFEQISVAQGNDDLLNAQIYYDACMDAAGPEFTHVYDGYSDPDCNACGKERATGGDFALGDLDGKEGVDTDDAIYLLYHVNFPGKYPVTQNVDYDGSGEIDLEDVFYLLYHVNFPERYPLS